MLAGWPALQNPRGVCNLIYLICPICGYSIDIFKEEEATDPVRSKRMKYLLTRDQICPNCINTIAKCEKIQEPDEKIPILRVKPNESETEKFIGYLRTKGYAVGTSYALQEFRGGK